ncbi:MAG: family 16 glycosylhydrolase [Pseudomonadota bacterium]
MSAGLFLDEMGADDFDRFAIGLIAVLGPLGIWVVSSVSPPSGSAELPVPAPIEEVAIAVDAIPEPVIDAPVPGEEEIASPIVPDLDPIDPADLIPSAPGFITLFGAGPNDGRWHRATHSNVNDFQANDWVADNATFTSDGAALVLQQNPGGPGQAYTGAEIQSRERYGYGLYEVVMRPARGSGSVSSFFTYTGSYFGDPHDEVDIEFLGQDTTKVYFNYFKDGRVGADYIADLPFDATDGFHIYAFEWRPDRIRWYVDGDLYYETPADDRRIPITPGGIFMNIWTGKGSLKGWHGRPDFGRATNAHYACVSFRAHGQETRSCSDVFLGGADPLARLTKRLAPVTDSNAAQ